MKQTYLKEAWWLTRFELRHSLISYTILAALFLFIITFSMPSLSDFKNDVGMGMDYNFLFLLFALPAIVKMQPFRSISVGNFIYAAPIHVLMRQLPINRSAYIMYILFHRFLLSATVAGIYLTFLYLFDNSSIPFNHYVSFILLWIAFSYTLHLLDAYSQFGHNLIIWISLIIITVFILFIVFLLVFYIYFYDAGFVQWTLDMAMKFPVYTSVVALLLIGLNIIFWSKMFRRKMNKMDLYY